MKFRKETFDKSNIYKAAEELKYSTLIKKVFEDEFDTPSDEFVRFVLNDIYTGKKNKSSTTRHSGILTSNHSQPSSVPIRKMTLLVSNQVYIMHDYFHV